MSRKLVLRQSLEPKELERLAEECNDPIEKQRWEAVRLVCSGITAKEAASRLGIHAETVRKAVARYNENGPHQMKDRRHLRLGGKSICLDKAGQEELRQVLSQPPRDGGSWNSEKVRKWLEQKLGRPVAKNLGWRYLKRLGFEARTVVLKESSLENKPLNASKTTCSKEENSKPEAHPTPPNEGLVKGVRYRTPPMLTEHSIARKAYPSDLTDSQWVLIEPYIPVRSSDKGREAIYPKREILNGIFYILRGGCAWRMMPHDLPDWRSVYHYFRQWKKDGTWQKIHDQLRGYLREAEGRNRMPSAGVVDTQSVKTTEQGGVKGYDGGKK